MEKVIHSARKSGMDNGDIARILQNSQISKQDVGYLIKGYVPRWRLSSMSVKSALKKSEAIFDRDTKRQILDRYKYLSTLSQ